MTPIFTAHLSPHQQRLGGGIRSSSTSPTSDAAPPTIITVIIVVFPTTGGAAPLTHHALAHALPQLLRDSLVVIAYSRRHNTRVFQHQLSEIHGTKLADQVAGSRQMKLDGERGSILRMHACMRVATRWKNGTEGRKIEKEEKDCAH
jgi:hypothetical protein